MIFIATLITLICIFVQIILIMMYLHALYMTFKMQGVFACIVAVLLDSIVFTLTYCIFDKII